MPAPTSQMRARARQLRTLASAIDSSGFDSLLPRAGEDVWIGPSAEVCRDDLARHGTWLARAADDLRAAASSLEQQADAADAAARAAASGGQ